MSERRLLLVVAAECSSMRPLTNLAAAARELDTVLQDVGDCRPALAGGRSLLTGPLKKVEVIRAVGEAVNAAAADGAVLVLAFLGHGFTPAGQPHLYYMVGESKDQIRDSAVDIGSLIADAADRPELAGVVVIVDTCYAGAAMTSAASVASGTAAGRVRLAILVAATAQQAAYDLAFSRGMSAVLRRGVGEADAHLRVQHVKSALDEDDLAPLQDVGYLDFDVRTGGKGLWLAHNRLSAPQRFLAGDVADEVERVIGPLFGGDALPRHWDAMALHELDQSIRALPPGEGPRAAAALLANLRISLQAADFVREQFGPWLTTQVVRRALLIADCPLWQTAPVGLDEVVGHLAVHYPATDPDCHRAVARFVAAICMELKQDSGAAAVQEWVKRLRLSEHFNDAVADHLSCQRSQQVRLIVGLHGSITGDWPDEIEAWLQDGGERLAHQVVGCQDQTEAAAGKALVAAVRWGRLQARRLSLDLSRVEIAAPEALLAAWRPEMVKDGKLLGLHYEFVLRWSGRLHPSDDLGWMNDDVREQLHDMASQLRWPPVSWLSPRETDDVAALEQRLEDGEFEHAIGLEQPIADLRVFTLLLTHAPIVLWPCSDGEIPPAGKAALGQRWHRMPGALHDAYRTVWKKQVDPLAAMRTVWDDEQWLDFCDRFNQLGI